VVNSYQSCCDSHLGNGMSRRSDLRFFVQLEEQLAWDSSTDRAVLLFRRKLYIDDPRLGRLLDLPWKSLPR
jgi:hypothetical protein